MNILEEYKKGRPEPTHTTLPQTDNTPSSWAVRLVMRASGGAITDVRQANQALLAIAAIACAAALAIAAANVGILPPPRFSEEESRKQMEEYRQIQPF